MKSIQVVKVGSLRDPNPETRGQVKVVDIPEQVLGDEDVRIKVAYCAICGSDPHLVENIFGWDPPYGMGHELSGVITEVGPKAGPEGRRPGRRQLPPFLRHLLLLPERSAAVLRTRQ